MSITDKLALVVTRRHELEQQLTQAADTLLAKYAAIPAKANQAFAKHHSKLDAESKGLDDLEHAIDQLSNSADPLGGS